MIHRLGMVQTVFPGCEATELFNDEGGSERD